MCGICGIINIDGKKAEEFFIRNMMLKMKHRGPDDEGVYLNNNVGLGFVRLSILDLSTAGHQPMKSHDGRYVIIFNGEVYNFIELKAELKSKYDFTTGTDTEVILAAFQEWGEKCLDRFNGMFAFVIFDTHTKNIFGARDRYGIKPFYYYQDANSFIFASEIDPILTVNKSKISPNEESIYNFLAHNRTDYNPNTFFNEINKLDHGCFFTLSQDGLKIKKWYDLNERVSIADQIGSSDQFSELLIDSVNLRLRSDVPVGVCLSGGIDSSTIVKIISEKLHFKDVNSFSAIYNKGQKGDESNYIMSLNRPEAHSYFTKLDENDFITDLDKLLEVHSEPFPGTAVYSQYKVMELAHGKVSVLLDGQGADEYLAGYHYFYGVYYKELIKQFQLMTFFNELVSYQNTKPKVITVNFVLFFT
ncbi:MAG: asparagine synthase (glutamine-hydrolyzing) [Bacteroidales bacterium]